MRFLHIYSDTLCVIAVTTGTQGMDILLWLYIGYVTVDAYVS